MAKKAILDVLESTIGKYVKNLDAESLNVAVWSGKIELHSLELNKDAVNAELDRQAAEAPNLAVPFRVTGGYFGNFEVDVPWARITSQPVVLRAKGLRVEVEPYDRFAHMDHAAAAASGVSDEARVLKGIEQRRKTIQAYDSYRVQANNLRKLAVEEDGEADESGSSKKDSSSFSARLVRRIIENLQVDIDDVHIALKSVDCSAGVVLGSLSLFTTDKNGVRAFIDRASSKAAKSSVDSQFLYKALNIQGLGIYLDDEDVRRRPFQISEGFTQSVAPQSKHSYILAPLSFEAKLRQSDDSKCLDHPKYLLSSELSQLSILLSRTQMDLARKISDIIKPSDYFIMPLFPEYRPLSRVTKESAKEWWRYATRCIGRIHGRRSWVEFFLAFQKRKKYIPLYKRNAHSESCPWIAPLNAEEEAQLKALNDDRTISMEGLMAWRTIADAQVEKEQEKADVNRKKRKSRKSSVYLSFFGTSSSRSSTVEIAEEDPPIVLSVEEMKELESVGRQSTEADELSKDSKLADIKFVLGSFKLNLSTYGMKPVLDLAVGRLGASFNANADGSYEFGLNLRSLEVRDRATPMTLFPVVLKNVRPLDQISENAFEMRTTKSTTGDQMVWVTLMAIEMIVSPTLVIETRSIFAVSKTSTSSSVGNPMLARSMTGSVDLFYDADEGSYAKPLLAAGNDDEKQTGDENEGMADRMATAMMRAWKEKAKEQVKWTVDCDVHAPIVILPQACTDVTANAIVLDMGHLRVKYGNTDILGPLKKWLDDNPPKFGTTLEPGTVIIAKFAVFTRNAKKLLAMAEAGGDLGTDGAILQPLSVSLDFAVESDRSADATRLYAFGVLPAIALCLSPEQVSASLKVVNKWKSVAKRLIVQGESTEDGVSILEAEPQSESTSRRSSKIRRGSAVSTSVLTTPELDQEAVLSTVFFLSLKKLSFVYQEAENVGIDAHLVSVDLKSMLYSDGGSVFRIQMGWFWILDRLHYDFARRQRIVAHSKLPKPAESFSSSEDIFQELTTHGVFDHEFVGNSDLADIQVTNRETTVDDGLLANFDDREAVTNVTVKFTSLFLNWNPLVIQRLTTTATKLLNSLTNATSNETQLVSPVTKKPPASQTKESSFDSAQTCIRVAGGMESLEFSLRSARDDEPIFILTMSKASVGLLMANGASNDKVGSFKLGDVQIKSRTVASVLTEYNSLLALSPGQEDSLLTITYFAGERGVAVARSDLAPPLRIDTFAEIHLSPMRLVYLQAQVMTLVEYATEGILGTLTSQAASSAVAVASEIVSSAQKGSVFKVKADGFDLVLPVSAENSNHFVLRASKLDVEYKGSPPPGADSARIALQGVDIIDHNRCRMTRDSVGCNILVELPPYGEGSLDDQAMKCNMEFPSAAFTMSRGQYLMVFAMLDDNIGEDDPKFRAIDSDENSIQMSSNAIESSETAEGQLTHAGVAFVERQRRIFVTISVKSLSFEFMDGVLEDSLLRAGAADATIVVRLLVDKDAMETDIVLPSLICEDTRKVSVGRQFRRIFHHDDTFGEATNIFRLEYANYRQDQTSSIHLNVGSPRFVFVADLLAEILSFVELPSRPKPGQDEQFQERSLFNRAEDSTDVVEVLESNGRPDLKSEVILDTKSCSIVLVDLGSSVAAAALERRPSRRRTSISNMAARASEAIILKGGLHVEVMSSSAVGEDTSVTKDYEIHGQSFEVFTANGEQLLTPLQILEPTSFTVVYHERPSTDATNVDCKIVTLNDVEILFSMQNLALINAISTSLTDSYTRKDGSNRLQNQGLSEDETQRIEDLATALERFGETSISESDRHLLRGASSSDLASTAVSSSNEIQETTQWNVRVTFPTATMTLINDLQGIDDALFRVTAVNVAAGAEANARASDKSSLTFHVNANTMLQADYFDSSVNRWKPLLNKPWELALKSTRSLNQRFRSSRLSTTFDLESVSCDLSVSEEFLVSLGATNQMWNVYSTATSSVLTKLVDSEDKGLKKALAATAARNLVVSLPFAIDNFCGLEAKFSCDNGALYDKSCRHGAICYFRFDVRRGAGAGGKRLYGQDSSQKKSVWIRIDGTTIIVPDVEDELGKPRTSHVLANGGFLMTEVIRDGNTTAIRLSSNVEFVNCTALPFKIHTLDPNNTSQRTNLGVCCEESMSRNRGSPTYNENGTVERQSANFGVPINVLRNGQIHNVVTTIAPMLDNVNVELVGELAVPTVKEMLLMREGTESLKTFDLICKNHETTQQQSRMPPFIIQVKFSISLLGSTPYLQIHLKPRASLENRTPVPFSVRTPMPYVFSSKKTSQEDYMENETVLNIGFEEHVEVFSPGASIAVSLKCSDKPSGGGATGWILGEWVDLPMLPEFRLHEPMRCLLPFESSRSNLLAGGGNATGIEVFITDSIVDMGSVAPGLNNEGVAAGANQKIENSREAMRRYFVSVSNYGVDHTGEILFEELQIYQRNSVSNLRSSINQSMLGKSVNENVLRRSSIATPTGTPFSAFYSKSHLGRLSLLPSSITPLRLLHLTMDGDAGLRRSRPFNIEDISICDGGIESTSILWEDGSDSGFFAYRSLVDSFQSEVHIVPEFIIHNGSEHHRVLVRQQTGNGPVSELLLLPRKVAPIRRSSGVGLILSLHYIDLGGYTPWMRMEELSHKVAIVRSMDNTPLGSIACQTVIGSRDSRVVVKLGPVKGGGSLSTTGSKSDSILHNDFLRLRVRWSELSICVKESSRRTKSSVPLMELGMDQIMGKSSPEIERRRKEKGDSTWMETRMNRDEHEIEPAEHVETDLELAVCSVVFQRFTMDWQRIFKEDGKEAKNALASPERSQLSVIVHHIQILDHTPNAPYPIVFQSQSQVSFWDLCLRFRGPLDADLIKVDLIDLNLSHINGVSERIILSTSEEFVWRLFDVADRILVATAELAGVDMELEWDEEEGSFRVNFVENKADVLKTEEYTPPRTDVLYDVAKARVSPFNIVVTFKRQPERKRYKKVKGVPGAKFVNYFTTRLKFTLEKAEIKFSRYESSNLKGPSDRIFELIFAVYLARMKLKIVSILSAVSLQDWKFLAAREDGDDEFVEGDLMRVAGNATGRSANFVLKKVSAGIGEGIGTVSNKLGDGIESAAGVVGARAVGAGVNSVVSGIGDGVGDTVKGVGHGAGKVLKGAGKGVGQVFGGVTGAALLVGKGIGKGVTTGDGKAVLTGLKDGAISIGTGVGSGLESTVMGTADGVFTVGKGVVSGVKSVGLGIGGAFMGGKKPKPPKNPKQPKPRR